MRVAFADRADAGRRLAARLADEHLPSPIMALALPRGGVTPEIVIDEETRQATGTGPRRGRTLSGLKHGDSSGVQHGDRKEAP